MDWPLAIVCYHRVLPEHERDGDGRPYFMRGTAVSDRNFAEHLRSFQRHFDVLAESDVIKWLNGERALDRPSCWITFDDGYRDLVTTAAPMLADYGFPATAFLTTDVVGSPGRLLPADHWYAALTRAKQTHGVLRLDGLPSFEFNMKRDYPRLVDGPERRSYLTAPPTRQAKMQAELAAAFGMGGATPARLYVDWSDVARLPASGWTFGGHGVTHSILTTLEGASLAHEVEAATTELRVRGLLGRVFAYPDGACSQVVASVVKAAGYRAGVVLGNEGAHRAHNPFALPRFIPGDSPAWVEEALLARLTLRAATCCARSSPPFAYDRNPR